MSSIENVHRMSSKFKECTVQLDSKARQVSWDRFVFLRFLIWIVIGHLQSDKVNVKVKERRFRAAARPNLKPNLRTTRGNEGTASSVNWNRALNSASSRLERLRALALQSRNADETNGNLTRKRKGLALAFYCTYIEEVERKEIRDEREIILFSSDQSIFFDRLIRDRRCSAFIQTFATLRS